MKIILNCGDNLMDQIRDNEFKGTGKVEVSELLEQFGRFDENPSSFLVNLLATQCFLGKDDPQILFESS